MNKKAQLYLLAAILVCLGIYGAVKINNKLEAPSDTDFSFYVDNFKGERTQVINLGYIKGGDITTIKSSDGKNMLNIFTEFGWNTGIILIEPINPTKVQVTNYLDDSIQFCNIAGCNGLSGAGEQVGALNFEIGTNKKVKVSGEKLGTINPEGFTSQPITTPFEIKINENVYTINEAKYQTIIFKDIDENFKKVEIV